MWLVRIDQQANERRMDILVLIDEQMSNMPYGVKSLVQISSISSGVERHYFLSCPLQIPNP